MSRCVVTLFVIVSTLQLVCSNDKKHGRSRRSLEVGDMLTPQDFIAVAIKLRSKVEKPGDGQGIVSSAKSIQVLADRLYSGFFFTRTRFMPVQEPDIAGLDALQALALCGDEFKPAIHLVADIDPDRARRSSKDKRRCRYALMTRKYVGPDDDGSAGPTIKKAIPKAKLPKKLKTERKKREAIPEAKNNSIQLKPKRKQYDVPGAPDYVEPEPETTTRRLIPEAKKLGKNRGIKINPGRRKREAIPDAKLLGKKQKKQVKGKSQRNNTNITSTTVCGDVTKPMQKGETTRVDPITPRTVKKVVKIGDNTENCIWKYMCKRPADMTTCQLYPECPVEGSNSTFDDIPIEHREDEHDENIKLVRKMIGVFIIDEEVEKIFERRHMMLFPKSKLKDDGKKEVESLKHYFDNLRIGQLTKTTKVYNPHSFEHFDKKKAKSRKSMFWNLKKGAHKPFRPEVKEEPKKVEIMGTGYNYPSSFPTTTPFRRF